MQILNDFSTTVKKALEEIDPNYMNYGGLVICGTHSPHDIQNLIEEIKKARENKIPFLGICFGHQLAGIEYAKNVLGIKNATSEEFHPTILNHEDKEFIVKKRKDGLKVGLYRLASNRLDSRMETYWNNYEIIDGFEDLWKKEDNFITCQYHPEYQSSKDNPHPLLVKFIEECKKASLEGL